MDEHHCKGEVRIQDQHDSNIFLMALETNECGMGETMDKYVKESSTNVVALHVAVVGKGHSLTTSGEVAAYTMKMHPLSSNRK